jgi:hypothetical protein
MSAREDTTAALAHALVRFNARVLALLGALGGGTALFVATWVLVLQGGETPGTMLGQLGHFFPGYSVTPAGAFAGALWGALAGGLLGWIFGRAYGPGLLRQSTRSRARADRGEEPGANVALLSPLQAGLTTAALLAGGLFVVTNWLHLRYGFPSPHLELLSNYLPGYTSDFAGSLVGAAWIFVEGFALAAAVAWIYNRVVRWRHPAELV